MNVSSEVMEGSSVTLHCEVDSNPPSRISWMFGDQEVLWDTASNISLALDDVTPAQEGLYTCVGDNSYGAMNTSLYLAVKCTCLRVSAIKARAALELVRLVLQTLPGSLRSTSP